VDSSLARTGAADVFGVTGECGEVVARGTGEDVDWEREEGYGVVGGGGGFDGGGVSTRGVLG